MSARRGASTRRMRHDPRAGSSIHRNLPGGLRRSRAARRCAARLAHIWRDGRDGKPPNNWRASSRVQPGSTTRPPTSTTCTCSAASPISNWEHPAMRAALFDTVRWCGQGHRRLPGGCGEPHPQDARAARHAQPAPAALRAVLPHAPNVDGVLEHIGSARRPSRATTFSTVGEANGVRAEARPGGGEQAQLQHDLPVRAPGAVVARSGRATRRARKQTREVLSPVYGSLVL